MAEDGIAPGSAASLTERLNHAFVQAPVHAVMPSCRHPACPSRQDPFQIEPASMGKVKSNSNRVRLCNVRTRALLYGMNNRSYGE